MDDIKVMYRWDKLSEKIMKHHGGIPGVIKFFEEGARTPSDDSLIIFFDGEEQLGGFEPGEDKIDYLIHPDQKSMGIQITIIMNVYEDEPCYPMISVSEEMEEADWDLPDEMWILTETEERGMRKMNKEMQKDTGKISSAIERLRKIIQGYGTNFCDLAMNMLDAIKYDQLDIDKLLKFEDGDFVHDIKFLVKWNNQTHKPEDEHALLRSSPDVNMFRNSYECSCGHKWTSEWEGTPNDRCPKCNLEIQPTCSEDLGDSNG